MSELCMKKLRSLLRSNKDVSVVERGKDTFIYHVDELYHRDDKPYLAFEWVSKNKWIIV